MASISKLVNDERFQELDEEKKRIVLERYFDKYVGVDDRYTALDPDKQNVVKERFFNKYVPPIEVVQEPIPEPLPTPTPTPSDDYYDYEAAKRAGITGPDETGHWPSEFKKPGHPNEYIDGLHTPTAKHEDVISTYMDIAREQLGSKASGRQIADTARDIAKSKGWVVGDGPWDEPPQRVRRPMSPMMSPTMLEQGMLSYPAPVPPDTSMSDFINQWRENDWDYAGMEVPIDRPLVPQDARWNIPDLSDLGPAYGPEPPRGGPLTAFGAELGATGRNILPLLKVAGIDAVNAPRDLVRSIEGGIDSLRDYPMLKPDLDVPEELANISIEHPERNIDPFGTPTPQAPMMDLIREHEMENIAAVDAEARAKYDDSFGSQLTGGMTRMLSRELPQIMAPGMVAGKAARLARRAAPNRMAIRALKEYGDAPEVALRGRAGQLRDQGMLSKAALQYGDVGDIPSPSSRMRSALDKLPSRSQDLAQDFMDQYGKIPQPVRGMNEAGMGFALADPEDRARGYQFGVGIHTLASPLGYIRSRLARQLGNAAIFEEIDRWGNPESDPTSKLLSATMGGILPAPAYRGPGLNPKVPRPPRIPPKGGRAARTEMRPMDWPIPEAPRSPFKMIEGELRKKSPIEVYKGPVQEHGYQKGQRGPQGIQQEGQTPVEKTVTEETGVKPVEGGRGVEGPKEVVTQAIPRRQLAKELNIPLEQLQDDMRIIQGNYSMASEPELQRIVRERYQPVEKPAKEPWEMTRKEYDTSEPTGGSPRKVTPVYIGDRLVQVVRNPNREDVTKWNAEHDAKYPNDKSGSPKVRRTIDEQGNTYEWGADEASHSMVEKQLLDQYGVKANQNVSEFRPPHKYAVADALKEGKSVPRNVLEEYRGESWADEALAKLEKPAEPKPPPLGERPLEVVKKGQEQEPGTIDPSDVRRQAAVKAAHMRKTKWARDFDGETVANRIRTAGGLNIGSNEIGDLRHGGFPVDKYMVRKGERGLNIEEIGTMLADNNLMPRNEAADNAKVVQFLIERGFEKQNTGQYAGSDVPTEAEHGAHLREQAVKELEVAAKEKRTIQYEEYMDLMEMSGAKNRPTEHVNITEFGDGSVVEIFGEKYTTRNNFETDRVDLIPHTKNVPAISLGGSQDFMINRWHRRRGFEENPNIPPSLNEKNYKDMPEKKSPRGKANQEWKDFFEDEVYGGVPLPKGVSDIAGKVARDVKNIWTRPRNVMSKKNDGTESIVGKKTIELVERTETERRLLEGKPLRIMEKAARKLQGLTGGLIKGTRIPSPSSVEATIYRNDVSWVRDNLKAVIEGDAKAPNERIKDYVESVKEALDILGQRAEDMEIRVTEIVKHKYIKYDSEASKYTIEGIDDLPKRGKLVKYLEISEIGDGRWQAESWRVKKPEGVDDFIRKATTRKFKKRKNYFPHVLTEEAYNALETQTGDLYNAILREAKIRGIDSQALVDEVDWTIRTRKYGNLENTRMVDMPDYVMVDGKKVMILETDSFKVIPRYIHRAARRLAIIKHFGQGNKKVKAKYEGMDNIKDPNWNMPDNYAQDLYHEMIKEGASDAAEMWYGQGTQGKLGIWQILQGKRRHDPKYWFVGPLRAMETAARTAQLSTSAVPNLGGFFPITVRYGTLNAGRNFVKVTGDSIVNLATWLGTGGKKPVRIMGDQYDLLRDYGMPWKETIGQDWTTAGFEGATGTASKKALKLLLFEGVNRQINKTAALSARDALVDGINFLKNPKDGFFRKVWGRDAQGVKDMLMREFDFTSDQISKMIDQGIADSDFARVVQKATAKINVTAENPLDRPPWMNGPIAKRVMAYSSYMRSQGNQLSDAVYYFKRGNVRPLLTTIFGYPVGGALVVAAKNFLYRKDQEDPEFIYQLVDAYMEMGVFGLTGSYAEDLYWSFERGKKRSPLEVPQFVAIGAVSHGIYKDLKNMLESGEISDDTYKAIMRNTPVLKAVDKHMEGPYWRSINKKKKSRRRGGPSRPSRPSRP